MTKLLRAASKVFGEWPARYGFEIIDDIDSHRSSTVSLANDHVRISIGCDWLEGEMDVTVETAGGGGPRDLADVVDLTRVKGLSTRRLARGITAGMLEGRLRKIAEVLETQAPELLATGSAPPRPG